VRLSIHKPTDVRSTPIGIFSDLNDEFDFNVYVCAIAENAKCDRFFSPNEDGLKQEWSGRIWCNPPYSDIYPWLQKGESSIKNGECDVAVFLLPSRTGTAWFHDFALKHEVRFIRGRLKFNGLKTSPTFDSLILVMRRLG